MRSSPRLQMLYAVIVEGRAVNTGHSNRGIGGYTFGLTCVQGC
jgi:hypothetical protein